MPGSRQALLAVLAQLVPQAAPPNYLPADREVVLHSENGRTACSASAACRPRAKRTTTSSTRGKQPVTLRPAAVLPPCRQLRDDARQGLAKNEAHLFSLFSSAKPHHRQATLDGAPRPRCVLSAKDGLGRGFRHGLAAPRRTVPVVSEFNAALLQFISTRDAH